jgi:Protein of unknown function (DUF3618)
MDDRTAGVSSTGQSRASEDPEARTLEIREEIEETRQEMSETIEAIQEKLRPSNLVSEAASATSERVKHMAYSAVDTAEDWWEASGGSSFLDRIRRNPVPAALAGAGLVWLAFSNGGHSRRSGYDYDRSASRKRGREYGGWQEGDASRESVTSRVASSAETALHETRRVARRSQNRLNQMLRDNPIAVGAGAMVLGAAVGLALPETERENELMGETRDNALEQAQHLAQTTVEKVKEAATDAAVRAATGD